MIMIFCNAVLIILAIIFMQHNVMIYKHTADENAKKRAKIYIIAVIMGVIFFIISVLQYFYLVDLINKMAR